VGETHGGGEADEVEPPGFGQPCVRCYIYVYSIESRLIMRVRYDKGRLIYDKGRLTEEARQMRLSHPASGSHACGLRGAAAG